MPEPHPIPTSINPASSAGLLAFAPIPSCSAARNNRLTSPIGSAAATTQQELRLVRKRLDSLHKSSPRSDWPAVARRQSEAARQLRRRQSMRQFQQRQRVAARLGHDPVTHALVQPPRHCRRQQSAGLVVREPATTSSGSPVSSLTSLGSRTVNTMPIRSASRRRATNASACTEARSSHCASSTRHTSGSASAASAKQAQDRKGHQEAIRGGAIAAARTRPQRIPLRTGQPIQPVQHRRAQLMQPRERELHLRLNARHPEGPTPRRGRSST